MAEECSRLRPGAECFAQSQDASTSHQERDVGLSRSRFSAASRRAEEALSRFLATSRRAEEARLAQGTLQQVKSGEGRRGNGKGLWRRNQIAARAAQRAIAGALWGLLISPRSARPG